MNIPRLEVAGVVQTNELPGRAENPNENRNGLYGRHVGIIAPARQQPNEGNAHDLGNLRNSQPSRSRSLSNISLPAATHDRTVRETADLEKLREYLPSRT
jgi:hypothetical protein